ncbi:MAG: hypothetical protein Q7W29_14905 [bacterium]|nr:hypothetical protein [bacterium]
MGLKKQLTDLAETLEVFVESSYAAFSVSRKQILDMSNFIATVANRYPVGSEVTVPIAAAQVTAAYLRNLIKDMPNDRS